MYEHKKDRLLPRAEFTLRVIRHATLALLILLFSLGLGVVGYRVTDGFSWIDALLNASMILGGMGPVDQLTNAGAKVFASAYALFSGLVFIAVMGVVFSPILHRMLHKFHLDEKDLRK